MSRISDSLMEDKRKGDPDDIITLMDAIIVVAKESISKMINASYAYKHGKLKMKNVKTNDANLCSERQVLLHMSCSMDNRDS